MKKLSLIILFLTICFNLKAQVVNIDTIKTPSIRLTSSSTERNNSFYHYSIAFKLYGLEQFPKILKQENYSDFVSTPLSGIVFKINDNQISYRFSGTYYNEDISFKNECEDCETTTGNLTDYSAKIGFEKALSYSVVQPYFGFDIGFRRNKFTGSSQNASQISYTAPYKVSAEKNGAVLTPLLGIKFNVINHITVGVESSIDILYDYERQEKAFQDDARTKSFKKFNNWEYLMKPVAMLSLQYNFELVD